MPDKKISELTLATPGDDDVIPFTDVGESVTYKALKSALKGDKGDKGDSFVSTLYEVNSPATIWTIIHNKGYYPSITVLDAFDREVIVEIEHNNLNQVTIKFEMLFTGKVVVN